MALILYNSRTGAFEVRGDDNAILREGTGYAGRRKGRNNPTLEMVRNEGPLPRGLYAVLRPRSHPRLGPLVMPLEPAGGQPMFGRSGFFIHGDSADGDASRGCIVLSRNHRAAIDRLGVTHLRVV
jgi:hypothetical protein